MGGWFLTFKNLMFVSFFWVVLFYLAKVIRSCLEKLYNDFFQSFEMFGHAKTIGERQGIEEKVNLFSCCIQSHVFLRTPKDVDELRAKLPGYKIRGSRA